MRKFISFFFCLFFFPHLFNIVEIGRILLTEVLYERTELSLVFPNPQLGHILHSCELEETEIFTYLLASWE